MRTRETGRTGRGSTAVLLALAATLVAGPARGQEPGSHRSTAAQRDAVAITIYNQNFGLVREVRSLDVGTGRLLLEYADVASAIQTETVRVNPLGGGLRVLEQNYRYDLLSPQKLLEKYVGRTVTVYRWNRAEEREEAIEAEVLSVNGGTVYRIGDEITYNLPGRLAFPEVPDDLIAEPTLMWLLDSRRARQRVEVSYLTGGLSWKADYVMVLSDDEGSADLTGWVTLTNQSGATYENARLKLVAGDVRRLAQQGGIRFEEAMARAAYDEVSEFSEEAFFEYHLYTLDRPTDLKQNEQKQVTLLSADGFDVEKQFVYYGAAQYYRGAYGHVQSNQKIGVFLEFANSEANGLGMPLPKGVIRVYKADGSGAQQFIGEDRIDHTPRDERVRVRMGEAFDVLGDRRQMDYTVISSCVGESTWRVQLRNHKDRDVTVEVVEPVGGDWEILRSTHEARKVDAHTFTFDVPVPAHGETEVEYRVRVRWC